MSQRARDYMILLAVTALPPWTVDMPNFDCDHPAYPGRIAPGTESRARRKCFEAKGNQLATPIVKVVSSTHDWLSRSQPQLKLKPCWTTYRQGFGWRQLTNLLSRVGLGSRWAGKSVEGSRWGTTMRNSQRVAQESSSHGVTKALKTQRLTAYPHCTEPSLLSGCSLLTCLFLGVQYFFASDSSSVQGSVVRHSWVNHSPHIFHWLCGD